MVATWKTDITDIPVKVLMDNIFPFCETKDVISLGCTNKFFALILTNMFWRKKLVVEYNFTGSETARMSGWKFIYERLKNPRVFVWGCVTFSFCYAIRCSLAYQCTHVCMINCNHPDQRTKANLGCHSFQRQPSQMFLFQLNFAFQVFKWSAWQQIKGQCRLHLYSQQISSSYFTYIPTGVSLHLVLMVVCMYGVGAFDLFHVVLKSPDTDNAS